MNFNSVAGERMTNSKGMNNKIGQYAKEEDKYQVRMNKKNSKWNHDTNTQLLNTQKKKTKYEYDKSKSNFAKGHLVSFWKWLVVN